MKGTRPPEATFTENQIEADGFNIHYLEAGEGDPVVILDGMMQGLSNLKDALAQNYRVVVLELPAPVESPSSAGLPSASDLAKTISQVVAKVVPGMYTLIGISFGANVALWHALQDPNKVESLVLVSPTAILPIHAPTEQVLPHRLEGATHSAEVESRLSEIQCPTLVVFGSKDHMVSSEAARVYRENIPNCNVSIVYDAGHMIGLERPEALVDVVADYVERRDTFVVNRDSTMINP